MTFTFENRRWTLFKRDPAPAAPWYFRITDPLTGKRPRRCLLFPSV